MKIKNSTIIKTLALCLLGGTVACQTSAPTNTTTNSNNANQATNKTTVSTNQTESKSTANTNQTETTKTEPTKTTTETTTPAGSLATPTEAYKTAYAARKNKDIAGLKRVLSKDMIEFFTIVGGEGKDPLETGLKELAESPQGATDESRNEKINGDTATLEYIEKDGSWKTMDFIKEGGEWKLTMAKGTKMNMSKTR